MKLLRFVVVLAVLAYAGWLAWPFLSPFFEGAGPETAAMRAGAEAQGGGELFGFLPAWTLWAAAIGLYLISALMLGSGNSRAAVAYFLALRLALDERGGEAARSGPATMSAPEAAASLPMDPIWLTLGVLLVLGVLVVIAGRRIRRARTPGQFAY